jgi:hypothetical protein
MSGRTGSMIGTFLFVLFGPLVWAGHLLAIYGSHASLCEFGALQLFGLPIVPILLLVATIGALALLAAGLCWPRRVQALLRADVGEGEERGWLTRLMRLLTGLSLVGVAYAGVAIMLVPICLPLR